MLLSIGADRDQQQLWWRFTLCCCFSCYCGFVLLCFCFSRLLLLLASFQSVALCGLPQAAAAAVSPATVVSSCFYFNLFLLLYVGCFFLSGLLLPASFQSVAAGFLKLKLQQSPAGHRTTYDHHHHTTPCNVFDASLNFKSHPLMTS